MQRFCSDLRWKNLRAGPITTALLKKGPDKSATAEVNGWSVVADTQSKIDAFRRAAPGDKLDGVAEFKDAMSRLDEKAAVRAYVAGAHRLLLYMQAPAAGKPDAGRPDAGPADAGRRGAGPADAGTRPDAGPADAGPLRRAPRRRAIRAPFAQSTTAG